MDKTQEYCRNCEGVQNFCDELIGVRNLSGNKAETRSIA